MIAFGGAEGAYGKRGKRERDVIWGGQHTTGPPDGTRSVRCGVTTQQY
ncbi:unnamed protein product, partial [Ectocarpus sp. 8 AP-2014]